MIDLFDMLFHNATIIVLLFTILIMYTSAVKAHRKKLVFILRTVGFVACLIVLSCGVYFSSGLLVDGRFLWNGAVLGFVLHVFWPFDGKKEED